MTANQRLLSLVMMILLVITSCTKKNMDNDTPLNNETNKSLCFTAEEAGVTIEMTVEGELSSLNIEYSTNGSLWFAFYPDNTVITLGKVGDKVYFRGDNPDGLSRSQNQYVKFVMNDKKVAANGNVMSLLDPTCESITIPNNWCFYSLFKDCEFLTKAPKLPAVELKDYCYSHMFCLCWNLIDAPELPAHVLARGCYQYMFTHCSNLLTVPELPAMHTTAECYSHMFSWCANLVTAPQLPATSLAESCYEGMFDLCRSLENVPEVLPATTIAKKCYYSMFRGCSIKYAPRLPATILEESCYNCMFSGCDKLIEAPELPAVVLADYCYADMFGACFSLVVAPELKATYLPDGCYLRMFEWCSNLTDIKVCFTGWSDNNYATSNWLDGVSSNGVFVCPSSLSQIFGQDHIPNDWNVETF